MGDRKKQRIYLACIVIAVLLGILIISASRRNQMKPDPAETSSETASETAEATEAAGDTTEAVEITSDITEAVGITNDTSEAVETVSDASEMDAETAQDTKAVTDRPEYAADPPDLSWLSDVEFPAYSGEPYTVMNGNLPYFETADLSAESYELYYPLDDLGRCTLADAVIGQDIMASGSRGDIWSVKPTGWHSDRYASVDGEALYNRCHLIAHYLSDEDANPRNLVTGTRYMNTFGMNAAENMVGDYVKESGNHVRYRVTPIFTGDHLLCDGLLVEAYSIEDEGEDICFCIYAHNVQPGFVIDYANGDNYAENGEEKLPPQSETAPAYEKYLTDEDEEGTYILNVKSKKFHRPDCPGAQDISEKNRKEYTGSRNQLVEEGYKPCGSCNP